MTIHLRFSLELDWEGIETVRQGVALCVQAALGSPELRDRLSMVTTELLENAVKYGKVGSRVLYSLEDRSEGLWVLVTNSVEPASSHIDAVRARIAWIETFDSPLRAYSTALIRAYEEQSDGGLGLVRVAHEGRCRVTCDSPRKDEITVSAHCERPRRRAILADEAAS